MRKIRPLDEQVLIEPCASTARGAKVNLASSIIIPEVAEEPSRTGKVLAVGLGKWVPGTWWKVRPRYTAGVERGNVDLLDQWEWIPGYRERMDVKPGDTVLFPRYAGVEFVRGEDAPEFVGLRLMKESDIILKIERN